MHRVASSAGPAAPVPLAESEDKPPAPPVQTELRDGARGVERPVHCEIIPVAIPHRVPRCVVIRAGALVPVVVLEELPRLPITAPAHAGRMVARPIAPRAARPRVQPLPLLVLPSVGEPAAPEQAAGSSSGSEADQTSSEAESCVTSVLEPPVKKRAVGAIPRAARGRGGGRAQNAAQGGSARQAPGDVQAVPTPDLGGTLSLDERRPVRDRVPVAPYQVEW